MNSNFKELCDALNEAGVEYLIVGGYAVIYHSRPRFTKDFDVWIKPDQENARKLMRAFSIFGLPLIGIEESDFAESGTQYQIGRSPTAIDFLTSLATLDFDECLETRVVDVIGGTRIPYLGKEHLIEAKKLAGRPEDLVDIRNLRMLDGEGD